MKLTSSVRALLCGACGAVILHLLIARSPLPWVKGSGPASEGLRLDAEKPSAQSTPVEIRGTQSDIQPDWASRVDRFSTAVELVRKAKSADTGYAQLSTIEDTIRQLGDTPVDARLLGIAFGYGFATREGVTNLESLGDENNEDTIYLKCIQPGVLSARERVADPRPAFQDFEAKWGRKLRENPAIYTDSLITFTRFSAESGMLEPESVVALLGHPVGGGAKLVKPSLKVGVAATEIAAVFSPQTFDAFFRELEKKFPGFGVEVLVGLSIPSETMSGTMQQLTKKQRDDAARRISRRALSLSPPEIEKIITLFPNPGEIPPDSASNLVFALALLGTDKLDAWIKNSDEKQRKEIYGNFSQLRISQFGLPQKDRMQLAGFRINQILRSPIVRQSITDPDVSALIDDCHDVHVLKDIYDELKSRDDDAGRKVRQNALSAQYYRTAVAEGTQVLEGVILNSKGQATAEERDTAARILVLTNIARAEQIQKETSDPGLARLLDEQIVSDPSYLYSMPFSEVSRTLSQRIASQNGNLSPGTKVAIQRFASSSGVDPVNVANLLAKLPEGKFREETLTSLVARQAEYDPQGASDWLSSMPASHSRDLAVSELVRSSQDDPEIALANVGAIQDPAIRGKAAESVVKRWSRLNPEATEQLIHASPLGQDEKEVLLKVLEANSAPASKP